MIKVFIDGKEGTTGLKLFDRLSAKNNLKILEIDGAKRKDVDARLALCEEADLVFLCLPDSSSKEMVQAIRTKGISTRIIDASSAHRIAGDFIYGLAELDERRRSRIATCSKLSNPGCHATGYVLSVRPLIDEGLISSLDPLACTSISGYSGAGRQVIEQYEKGEVAKAPRLYSLTQNHKHLPEMLAYTKGEIAPSFTPIINDFYAGLLTCTFIYSGGLFTRSNVHNVLAERYENEKLVHVRSLDYDPEQGFLAADAFAGYDDLEISVQGNDERIEIVARYDNLGKGASGAALQNMNIMLGLDEHDGLLLRG